MKDRWISEAEAIDALLHIADEEAVRIRTIAADGAENRVLRGVDVLILVHENMRETRAPTQPNSCGRFRICIPKQSQSELFEVRKIHASGFTLGPCKVRAEVAHQSQQGQHLMPRPFPILSQRINAIGIGGERVKKFRFGEAIIEDIAHFACVTVRPFGFERFRDGHESFGDLFHRRFSGQRAKRCKAELDIL